MSTLEPSKPKSLHHSGHNYFASVLSIRGLGGLDFNMVYCGGFFRHQFFTSLINVDNWVESPQAQPIPSHNMTAIPAMHIYDFLASIQSIPVELPVLPANGLSIMQACHVDGTSFSTASQLSTLRPKLH
jgi:hypothetical protein